MTLKLATAPNASINFSTDINTASNLPIMTTSKPVIVIIPGGFHRPAHYSKIIVPLQSQGYTVLSVPLVVCGDTDISPDATPVDDVKALHDQLLPLLDAGHEAIVVAHSYGSLVATAAIQDQTRTERSSRGLAGGVVGAIWIAGFAYPVRGRSISGGEEEMEPLPYQVLKVRSVHPWAQALSERKSLTELEWIALAHRGSEAAFLQRHPD